MKKLLLCIVMLFSIAINSTELSDKLRGAWSSDKTSYMMKKKVMNLLIFLLQKINLYQKQ